jgi:Fe-coproporphyrin III synthase
LRYRSLHSGQISSLPLLILMPHSGCNCKCLMCDIWKGNGQTRQLTLSDIEGLLPGLKSLRTQRVLMSGGEALLNPLFFQFCGLLKTLGIRISLLSTGLLLQRYAERLVACVDEVIVSLDGDPVTHDRIRNVPGAFEKMRLGLLELRRLRPGMHLSGRSVIHRLNFRCWDQIVSSARYLGLDSISFLPADVSSHAFNREQAWGPERQQEILPPVEELNELAQVLEDLVARHPAEFLSGFIAESPARLRQIPAYYQALHGLGPFPYKRCNAPWVSAVIEADGSLRPCFFHAVQGNLREASLSEGINSRTARQFRQDLDVNRDPTCERCVCHLYLSPGTSLG